MEEPYYAGGPLRKENSKTDAGQENFYRRYRRCCCVGRIKLQSITSFRLICYPTQVHKSTVLVFDSHLVDVILNGMVMLVMMGVQRLFQPVLNSDLSISKLVRHPEELDNAKESNESQTEPSRGTAAFSIDPSDEGRRQRTRKTASGHGGAVDAAEDERRGSRVFE